MMATCPVCGKLTCIHWPEHWVYRRGETYYCSAMCMDVDIVKDLNLMKQVNEQRRKRKEAMKMYTKMKKDGTPAKKSGPKPKNGIAQVKVDGPIRIETPEANKVEVVETPEKENIGIVTPELLGKAEKTAQHMVDEARKGKEKNFGLPAYIDGFEIVGIKGQFGTYRASDEYNYFEFVPFGGELCMNPGDWREQLEELQKAAKVLGVKL